MTVGKCQLVSRVGEYKGYIHDAHNGTQIIMRHIIAITYNQLILFWLLSHFSFVHRSTNTNNYYIFVCVFLAHSSRLSSIRFRFVTNTDRTKWMDWHGTNERMWENDGQHEAQVTGLPNEKKTHTSILIAHGSHLPFKLQLGSFSSADDCFLFFFFAATAFSSRLNR